MKLSVPVATASFAVYSVLNGLTLSPIFYIYTEDSIASTFFVTAGTFGAMALFGYVTKRDLSRWGSLLFMALIGLIIASVVNWFLASTTLMWITTYAGVLIFVGLTAYDTQKLKKMLWETAGEATRRASPFLWYQHHAIDEYPSNRCGWSAGAGAPGSCADSLEPAYLPLRRQS